jgi:hypothetical protein
MVDMFAPAMPELLLKRITLAVSKFTLAANWFWSLI